jgi:hypothetical protein
MFGQQGSAHAPRLAQGVNDGFYAADTTQY